MAAQQRELEVLGLDVDLVHLCLKAVTSVGKLWEGAGCVCHGADHAMP